VAERLFGIETEYGIACAAGNRDGATRDAIAYGLATRAREEAPCIADPASQGVFFQNGARFYVDCGHHPEMTTPEVANPWDVARYILAGERILEQLARPRHGEPEPLLLKTNVDYLGSSWGCHESFGHKIDPEILPDQLIPHLATRPVFAGAGGFNPFSPGVEFVLSPRALMIEQASARDSTCGRGIFHTKNEPLAAGGYNRAHIIVGESLCSETAMWLRTATTVLVIALVEGGVRPGADVALDDPVRALHAIVGDPTCRVRVAVRGRELTALQIQRHYLRLAEEHVRADFMPPWAETACQHWRHMLDRLEDAPDSVSTVLDWGIKRKTSERVLGRHGFTWARIADWTKVLTEIWSRLRAEAPRGKPIPVEALLDPPDRLKWWMGAVNSLVRAKGLSWDGIGDFIRLRQELFECDVRFSQLGGQGIFAALDRAGVLDHHFEGVDNIEHAVEYPPAIGRAKIRGDVIRRVQPSRDAFEGSWEFIKNLADHTVLDLTNPFETEERWNPASRPASRPTAAEPVDAPLDVAEPEVRGSTYHRRGAALDSFLRDECPEAERILLTLVDDNFDLPGTFCHLARVYLKMGQDLPARAAAAAAWEHRSSACRYVLGRTLWFRVLFALLDGEDASPWIGRVKTLGPDGDVRMGWTMEPVLRDLRGRMVPASYAIAVSLFQALAGHRGGGSLQRKEWWTSTEAVPID